MTETGSYRAYIQRMKNISFISLLIRCRESLSKPDGPCEPESVEELLQEVTACLDDFQTEGTCPHCGGPLYLSDLPQYDAVCYTCDENF